MIPKSELFFYELPEEMYEIDNRIFPAGNPGIDADKCYL
jgi:hypothetical protein